MAEQGNGGLSDAELDELRAVDREWTLIPEKPSPLRPHITALREKLAGSLDFAVVHYEALQTLWRTHTQTARDNYAMHNDMLNERLAWTGLTAVDADGEASPHTLRNALVYTGVPLSCGLIFAAKWRSARALVSGVVVGSVASVLIVQPHYASHAARYAVTRVYEPAVEYRQRRKQEQAQQRAEERQKTIERQRQEDHQHEQSEAFVRAVERVEASEAETAADEKAAGDGAGGGAAAGEEAAAAAAASDEGSASSAAEPAEGGDGDEGAEEDVALAVAVAVSADETGGDDAVAAAGAGEVAQEG